jgi:hypothetical protein
MLGYLPEERQRLRELGARHGVSTRRLSATGRRSRLTVKRLYTNPRAGMLSEARPLGHAVDAA